MLPDLFHPAVRAWFERTFGAPTPAQQRAWPIIARGDSTLLLAPTGNGKTLAAFLWCLDRLLFAPRPASVERCRVVYVSPLKALATDIERNLQAPLAGIAAVARERGVTVPPLDIALRTGDTPAAERARFARRGADIVITTPESLFLLLTSDARARLASVDTVIVDEIHALLPGKRGAHLALTLERLERLDRSSLHTGPRPTTRRQTPPGARRRIQRIGLSATQRPTNEAAQFLAGVDAGAHDIPAVRARGRRGTGRPHAGASARGPDDEPLAPPGLPPFRPVTVVDASEPKPLALQVEVPVEHAARLEARAAGRKGHTGQPRRRPHRDASLRPTSIWSSVYPRLLELIRAHSSTLLFVNNRRLAERLADALNALAGEPLVRSHHGSLAPGTRDEVERLLKAGAIRALVTTSSLELGIDMGAIDLVVQVEAPPSVASGLQRIGRAGHRAGAVSAGVIVPKFRGDLLACAACTRAMHEGRVEATHYPRNPLDVLAQQIVAAVALDAWRIDDLFALVRGAAPFATLSRDAFEGVLDMLSGRYPSDAFAELRPRVTWDRVRGILTAREGARRVVVANAGTIPDRGLYGVFLAGAGRPVRVGELDEEMVFETRVGDTFTLGASTWRVDDITHDRVIVSAAPGEPGRMPFWHGDQAGRSVELGAAIGALVRDLRTLPRAAAETRLVHQHDLDRTSAGLLLDYLRDQAAAGVVPDDRTIVVERCLDELGDWRLCVLTPFGSRLHAPWAMAAAARIRQRTGFEADIMWGDEGFVVRLAAADGPPDPSLLLPEPGAVERLVLGQIAGSALFAARFREAAARALLLPRRRPGSRTPLWRQRKRAADLLAAVAPYGSFPIVLEAHREILRDHFDMPALVRLLARVASGDLDVRTIDTQASSPFAASLLFSYVANYIYDGDAPLAERRAQALSVDQAQLRELIGDAELRELLDGDALVALERQLQHLDERLRARSPDAVHDLLLRLGDLSGDEIAARSVLPDPAAALARLHGQGRIVRTTIAGQRRYIAVEDAARYRDALGAPLAVDLPAALLAPVDDADGDLVLRHARTHGPFTVTEIAGRLGMEPDRVHAVLTRLSASGRVIEGEFRPHGSGREWIDADVLRTLRRRSLARLRREIEPVEPDAFTRFLLGWHGIGPARRGVDALLDAVEQLQGAPLPASVLEGEILAARVADYQPAMLDTLVAAGEVVWVGVEAIGARDGRVALYLTDRLHSLSPAIEASRLPPAGSRAADVLTWLRANGASFFAAVHAGTGGGYPQETVDALWDLVWRGLVTNDTVHALRAYLGIGTAPSTAPAQGAEPFRSRRLVPTSAQGRWSALDVMTAAAGARESTARATALARQLLTRHGLVTREAATADAVPGGLSTIYPVLRAMEDAGRVRRGYFVTGLGGVQFAMPAALDLLREARTPPDTPHTVVLSAVDPANPYGAILEWPSRSAAGDGPDPPGSGDRARRRAPPARVPGAVVIFVDGRPVAYLRRGDRELLLLDDEGDARRTPAIRAAARALLALAATRPEGARGMLIPDIDGMAATGHPAARLFAGEGFAVTALGLQVRTDRLRPRGYSGAGTAATGTDIAAPAGGGTAMAERHENTSQGAPKPRHEDRAGEQERVRSSNDRDQARERAGESSRHNEGYDEAAAGGPVDPDSPFSEVDRDDMLEE